VHPASAQEREWAADERRSTPIRNFRVLWTEPQK
jgi:hypothetical protein